MRKPDFSPNDAVEFWDLVNRQDSEISNASNKV